MAAVFWSICSSIMVDYMEDLDLNNLAHSLDEKSAECIRAYWKKQRLDEKINRKIEMKLLTTRLGNSLYLTHAYSHDLSDFASADITFFKIKQDLSKIDIIQFCKAYLFETISSQQQESFNMIDINKFDATKKVNLKATYDSFKGTKYCSSKFDWNVLLESSNCNVDISSIASCIYEGTEMWTHKVNIAKLKDVLNKLLLPNLILPWKQLCVYGAHQTQTPGPNILDEFKAEAVHLWYFFDKAQNNDYFTQAILLRVMRDFSDTNW